MKVFIDTTQSVFIGILFDDNFNVIDKHIVNTTKKVEEVVVFFNEKVKNISSIKEIYINIGPGSFVGSRAALIYARTVIQLNANIKLFQTTSFDLIKKRFMKSKTIYATKNKSYVLKKNKIFIVRKSKHEQLIDYDEIILNFDKYKSLFTQIDPQKVKPLYASEPQIGGN